MRKKDNIIAGSGITHVTCTERRMRVIELYSLKSVEGYSQGGWILLDYYDIIVHIFSDEARRFYDIERIWNDAADVTKDLLS